MSCKDYVTNWKNDQENALKERSADLNNMIVETQNLLSARLKQIHELQEGIKGDRDELNATYDEKLKKCEVLACSNETISCYCYNKLTDKQKQELMDSGVKYCYIRNPNRIGCGGVPNYNRAKLGDEEQITNIINYEKSKGWFEDDPESDKYYCNYNISTYGNGTLEAVDAKNN